MIAEDGLDWADPRVHTPSIKTTGLRNMADKSPRYAEDYRVGEVFDLGQIVITRDEIIEFV